MAPETGALVEALFAMMQMLIMLLLEKKTRKTSKNSSLPGSLTPFDKTAPAKAGANGKGPEHGKGDCASTRIEVDARTSAVDACSHCGEDLSEVAAEDRQRRALVDIGFVTKETRIGAEIKRCPNCACVNRGAFPGNMPGPLQYGDGIIAFATDLLIARMAPLRRTAQMLNMITGRSISEASLLNWVMRVHHRLGGWETAAAERLLAMPVLHAG